MIDDRPEFANRERFPDARAIHAGEIEAALRDAKAEPPLARLHRHPRPRLRRARAALGGGDPRRLHRHDRLAAEGAVRHNKLKLEGVSDEQFAQVHAPVGLNIGAVTPEEIAISVVAEMIATMRKSDAARPAMRNMREVGRRRPSRRICTSENGTPKRRRRSAPRGRSDRRRGVELQGETLRERQDEANPAECERRRPLGRRRKDRVSPTVLREQMLLTGCKVCCEDGQCGTCTVIVDGKPDRCCRPPLEKVRAGRQDRHHRRRRHGRTTCIRCRSPGWRMAGRSAASARRASSCRPRCCSTATRRRRASRCAPGSTATATSAAAPATSRWSTR